MKTKLLKSHICAYNDGKQSCDCFLAAIMAVRKEIAKMRKKFANTPLNARLNGWDWLNRLEIELLK